LWLSYSLGVQKGLKNALKSHNFSCPIFEQNREIKHFPKSDIEPQKEIQKKKSETQETLPHLEQNITNTDENPTEQQDKSPSNGEQNFTYLHGRNFRNFREKKAQPSQENINNESNFDNREQYQQSQQNTRQPVPVNYDTLGETPHFEAEARPGPAAEINLDNVPYHIFSFTVEDFDQAFKSEFDDFIQKLGTSAHATDNYIFTIQMQDAEGAIYNVYKNDGYEYISQFQSSSLPQLNNESFHAIDKLAFSADSKKIIIKPNSTPNIDFLYQAYLSDLHRQPAFVSNDNYTLFKISPDLFILQHKVGG